MFRKVSDFEKYWADHSAETEKILEALTDASLSQAVAHDHRTIGRLAWHIVVTIPGMLREAGVEAADPAGAETVPKDAESILAGYREVSKHLKTAIREAWTDEMLTEEIEMYGERWTRGMFLFAIPAHEIHHRGQLTVLMRQAGLKVPGVYGPAREEWPNYGMPEPAI